MKSLQDTTVLVLGLGESGLAMAQWCARQGAVVRVADSREHPPRAAELAASVPAAQFEHGFDVARLDGVQRVFKSPGLSPVDVLLVPLLARAAELGVPVQGELDLFAQALAELKVERGYAPKVIAITGTNGKTTTTVMCGQLIERSGLRVAVAGNVGPTMLASLAAALEREGPPSLQPAPAEVEEAAEPIAVEAPFIDSAAGADDSAPIPLTPPPPSAPVFEHLPDAWILELSSFQLDTVQGFEPSAAVVLNLSQDHLDWHGSMAAYAKAKARVYGGASTVMVVNRDDPEVQAMVPPPQIVKGATRGARSQTVHRKVVRFGLDAPRAPGDYGLVIENGMAWLVRALEADETLKRKKGDDTFELHVQRLMPADALRIRGRHNAANALAALALATAIGRPLAPMLHGLRDYRGEPHRVEFLATVGEIEAYDDSKGTNVGATVAAIDGLGADKAPARLAVILGGDGKGQDFGPLAAPVARHARSVALIGRDAPALEAVLSGTNVPLARHATLEDATRWCFEQARPGDAVLMSPACASLDMFRNYEHRAEVFAATVQALALERGEAA
ncbi:UDP-N-acetylmuramoyl-L-alanine--D-glutamate ligase [Methylibium sp.]|uniref:UDP-N-acetylmuramoyl-L-alanine--D-glutamate ligase n=1 Tax=Methylibium sp. TaxID=2067992 RepID=UPI001805A72F|nr:UDP-N-acetylmuramoyl-L-alanine--D-glutamate ligase [Methylibium sp.]MBA3590402.1 UDP-N-acetylmuramoyl-L-alanine--D-glutamate ligase [Methylibium sp.]